MESRWVDARLDSRWHGAGAPVVLLHPHPLFGGTMGSRLVYDLAVGLASAGRLAVRFDFRGVGRSKGLYGAGEGETQDALAVLDEVEKETGELPDLVGYSFGGAVATRVARIRPVRRLVLVATPSQVRETVLEPVADAANAKATAHIVVGDRDEIVPLEDARRLAAAFRPAAGVSVIAGAGHFLDPRANAQAVAAVVAALDAP